MHSLSQLNDLTVLTQVAKLDELERKLPKMASATK